MKIFILFILLNSLLAHSEVSHDSCQFWSMKDLFESSITGLEQTHLPTNYFGISKECFSEEESGDLFALSEVGLLFKTSSRQESPIHNLFPEGNQDLYNESWIAKEQNLIDPHQPKRGAIGMGTRYSINPYQSYCPKGGPCVDYLQVEGGVDLPTLYEDSRLYFLTEANKSLFSLKMKNKVKLSVFGKAFSQKTGGEEQTKWEFSGGVQASSKIFLLKAQITHKNNTVILFGIPDADDNIISISTEIRLPFFY